MKSGLLALFLALLVLTGCSSSSSPSAVPPADGGTSTPAPQGPTPAPGGPKTGTAVRPAALSAAEAAQIPGINGNADSVWKHVLETKDGFVTTYVWTGPKQGGSDPFIAVTVADGQTSTYKCPRSLGHLTITGLSGSTVQFTSTAGTGGSFGLQSQNWTFDK